jgi:hypothetical protein
LEHQLITAAVNGESAALNATSIVGNVRNSGLYRESILGYFDTRWAYYSHHKRFLLFSFQPNQHFIIAIERSCFRRFNYI